MVAKRAPEKYYYQLDNDCSVDPRISILRGKSSREKWNLESSLEEILGTALGVLSILEFGLAAFCCRLSRAKCSWLPFVLVCFPGCLGFSRAKSRVFLAFSSCLGFLEPNGLGWLEFARVSCVFSCILEASGLGWLTCYRFSPVFLSSGHGWLEFSRCARVFSGFREPSQRFGDVHIYIYIYYSR